VIEVTRLSGGGEIFYAQDVHVTAAAFTGARITARAQAQAGGTAGRTQGLRTCWSAYCICGPLPWGAPTHAGCGSHVKN